MADFGLNHIPFGLRESDEAIWFTQVAVDLKGRVGDFEFVVYLVHPGRQVPPELEALDGAKVGLVAIELHSLGRVFARATQAGEDLLGRFG
jgi:hypothetical protein